MNRCDYLLADLRLQIATELRAIRAYAGRPLSVLDVGCWDGETTAAYQAILGGPASGVEVFADEARRARARGVDVAEVDLERERFPWPDASVDVVVCNQVFEHLKNIFLPMSEMARVLRPGGWLVYSVPNLAALHNRLLLLLGRQPSTLRVPGPHVRAYTLRQTRAFLEDGGVFAVTRVVGVGSWRYGLGGPLSRLAPHLSAYPVLVAEKRGEGAPWLARAGAAQTYYEPITCQPAPSATMTRNAN